MLFIDNIYSMQIEAQSLRLMNRRIRERMKEKQGGGRLVKGQIFHQASAPELHITFISLLISFRN